MCLSQLIVKQEIIWVKILKYIEPSTMWEKQSVSEHKSEDE